MATVRLGGHRVLYTLATTSRSRRRCATLLQLGLDRTYHRPLIASSNQEALHGSAVRGRVADSKNIEGDRQKSLKEFGNASGRNISGVWLNTNFHITYAKKLGSKTRIAEALPLVI